MTLHDNTASRAAGRGRQAGAGKALRAGAGVGRGEDRNVEQQQLARLTVPGGDQAAAAPGPGLHPDRGGAGLVGGAVRALGGPAHLTEQTDGSSRHKCSTN